MRAEHRFDFPVFPTAVKFRDATSPATLFSLTGKRAGAIGETIAAVFAEQPAGLYVTYRAKFANSRMPLETVW